MKCSVMVILFGHGRCSASLEKNYNIKSINKTSRQEQSHNPLGEEVESFYAERKPKHSSKPNTTIYYNR